MLTNWSFLRENKDEVISKLREENNIIGLNGKSANMTTIHPLEYAVYKNWLGQREDRDFLKHARDIEQSKLVTKIMTEYMPNIDVPKEISSMRHINKEVVLDYMDKIYSKSHAT